MEPRIKLSHTTLKLIAELDEFKGRWAATSLLAPERLSSLKAVATIESIGSSTRIEGVQLSDSQIEKLLGGIGKHSFISRDEQEVAGYAEAMNLIFSSFEELQLNENHIKQLHSALLKFSSKDERHRGEYKKFPNHVEAFDANKKSMGIVFQTSSPFDTPREMNELVEWTRQNLSRNELHPLLVIAVFVVSFLAIHPFQDGNGRLSRVLTSLLLLKAGYSYVPYSSLERVVETNKDAYYLSLRRAQATLKTDSSKLNDWIDFFLECMKKQKDNLQKRLSEELLLQKLSGLSADIVALAKDRSRISISDIVNVTGKNRNTVKAHLRTLVSTGRLLQEGTGKGTWYKPA